MWCILSYFLLCLQAMHYLGIPTTRGTQSVCVGASVCGCLCMHTPAAPPPLSVSCSSCATTAGTCVTSDTRVERDIRYDGHPKMERATVVSRIAQTFLRLTVGTHTALLLEWNAEMIFYLFVQWNLSLEGTIGTQLAVLYREVSLIQR